MGGNEESDREIVSGEERNSVRLLRRSNRTLGTGTRIGFQQWLWRRERERKGVSGRDFRRVFQRPFSELTTPIGFQLKDGFVSDRVWELKREQKTRE